MRLPIIAAMSFALLASASVHAQTEANSDDTVLSLEAGIPVELNPGADVGDEIGKFRFMVNFEPTTNPELGLIRNLLQRTSIFEAVADELSDQIALPQDLPINFKECGNVGAHFSVDEHAVTLCYELAADFFDDYSALTNQFAPLFPWADHREVTIGSILFVMLHEIGHAMVDQFDLPITGREEDVVDQFAIFALTNSDEEAQDISERPSRFGLLAAYGMLKHDYPIERAPRAAWSDEHGLDPQRGRDLLCMVLGSDPQTYILPIAPGLAMIESYYVSHPDAFTVPQLRAALDKADDLNLIHWERAAQCGRDYAKYEASWDYIIETFMTPKSNQVESENS